ncbi:MAG: TIGR02281 family clan AA aspartic protease [Alphaproteobacteria bacterium]
MTRSWVLLVGAVAALAGYLAWRYPDAVASQNGWVRVAYLVALLALVSAGVVARRRLPLRRALGQALVWGALALALVVGYSFRFELEDLGARILGALQPSRGTTIGDNSVSFRAGVDGHFRVEALVDGVPIRFLVDTGASDVVLRPADARRLGLDPGRLVYSRLYRTANGVVRGAPVRLGEVTVGPIRVTGIVATVNEAAMESSLLGIGFLGRLRGYEVRADTLILHR